MRTRPPAASCQRWNSSRSGRTDPLPRMGAARAILGRDVGAFDVEAVDRAALGQGLASGREIAQAFQHALGRAR